MEYNVNQQNIQKYAERLTTDLCRQFFVNKAFISGPEILSFNPEHQINLLIIKNIYLNWQKETLRLKSIYFDYEDEEVKLALTNFMNILSNHIKVYRSDFEVLLKKSIAEFILLSAAPQEFFVKECEVLAGPKISLNLLKEFSKYIKVNSFVLEQIIREIEALGYTETFGGETVRFVMKALSENPGKHENPEESLKKMFEQLPARVTEFVSIPKPPVTRPSFLDTPKEELSMPEPVQFVKPIPEPIREEVKPQEIDIPAVQMDVIEESESNSEDFTLSPDSEDEVVSEDIAVPVIELEEEQEEVMAVFQKPEPAPKNENPKPLVEEIETTDFEPVYLAAQQANVMPATTQSVPFKTLVPMHYRFAFINGLFGGNNQVWAEAVDLIDAAQSSEDAIAALKLNYSERFSWANDEDNVGILFNYVERRF